MPVMSAHALEALADELPAATRERLDLAVNRIVAAKERGGETVVVTVGTHAGRRAGRR